MKNKNILISVFIIILLLAFAYLFSKNYKNNQQAQIVPTDDSSVLTEEEPKVIAEPKKVEQKWLTFTGKFGLSLQYPSGWIIEDASYQSGGSTSYFVWIKGPERDAPLAYGYTKARFNMPICYMGEAIGFSNECYGEKIGEDLLLLYPGGTQSPNIVELNKEETRKTEDYKTAIKIMQSTKLIK